MRYLRLLVVPLLLVLILPACDLLDEIDPVETVCALCDMVDESGLCEIIQSVQDEKCEPGQVLVFTNLKEAVKNNVPLETGCK